MLLVLGIFIGSYIAAKGLKNLDGDCEILRQFVIVRLVFMDFGASVAGGCSIGNGLVETANELARMDCFSLYDYWCLVYELFYFCKTYEKVTTSISKLIMVIQM